MWELSVKRKARADLGRDAVLAADTSTEKWFFETEYGTVALKGGRSIF